VPRACAAHRQKVLRLGLPMERQVIRTPKIDEFAADSEFLRAHDPFSTDRNTPIVEWDNTDGGKVLPLR